jgi:hypothetical protein
VSFNKTNIPGYSKDKKTGVVINTQESELQSYKKQRAAILENKKLKEEVENLKKEMAEQKELMLKVLLEVGILKQ